MSNIISLHVFLMFFMLYTRSITEEREPVEFSICISTISLRYFTTQDI
jgi:hypothetical protein